MKFNQVGCFRRLHVFFLQQAVKKTKMKQISVINVMILLQNAKDILLQYDTY